MSEKVWGHEHPCPQPQDMVPGFEFRDGGALIRIKAGKHGEKDRRVEVVMNGPPTYRILSVLIMAMYIAEERYDGPRQKGGEYLVAYISSWVHWVRSGLGKPSPGFGVIRQDGKDPEGRDIPAPQSDTWLQQQVLEYPD